VLVTSAAAGIAACSRSRSCGSGRISATGAATQFGEIVVQGGVAIAIINAVVAECLPGPGTSS
jgi:hypothetical protein